MATYGRHLQTSCLAATLLVVALALTLSSAVLTLPSQFRVEPNVVPLSSSCSSIASNESLLALVDPFYLHGNASVLPTQSVADQSVVAVWGTVCSSAPFAAAYSSQSQIIFADSVQIQDKNQTASGAIIGSLFVSFKLTWNDSCPSGSTSYPAGFGCVFSDAWSGNLTTGVVVGPAQNVVSARFVQCNTPYQNISNVQAIGAFYPNPLQRPNQTVAAQEVQTLWGEVCASESYFQIFSAHPGAITGGASAWTTVGSMNATQPSDLFVQWSIGWNAACSQGPSCFYAEEWTADLGANSVLGPQLSISVPLGSPPGPGTNGSPGGWTSAWTPTVQIAIVTGMVAAVLGVAAFYRARGGRVGSPSRIYQGFAVRPLNRTFDSPPDTGSDGVKRGEEAQEAHDGNDPLDDLLR